MILSRTMRHGDFAELEPELQTVDEVLALLGGGDPAQHPMRRWEYAMALKAFNDWAQNITAATGKSRFVVSDHGCCTGMFSPMMYHLGHSVRMYEIWAWGDQEQRAVQQMAAVFNRMSEYDRTWRSWQMIHKPLEQLDESDKADAAYCISTIEHIADYEGAFRNLCRSVLPGGMLFLTSDFGERGGFGFAADSVRPNGMFYEQTYLRMAEIGAEEGFRLMGGEADWSWEESCRMVNDYGFAALAMERV